MGEEITVECRIIRETDAAILIEVDDEEIWIPFSQVQKIVRPNSGPAQVTMTRWIADKKGLID